VEDTILFHIGPLAIRNAVVTTWAIMALLAIAALLTSRRLRLQPDHWQAAVEGALGAMDGAVRAVLAEQTDKVLPFIATLWIFLVVANLSGIVPGVNAPTGQLSTTAGLAILVFLSVHWFGICNEGLKAYLAGYLKPSPLMLPFNIISEISRTVALAVRLFGNIMSLEMAALLILLVAGFLAPVPILMLHIVEALVQAYIFGMLALIYIAGGIQSQQLQRQREKE
jgi:F-type H+-transporting ATPase subunit a